MWWRMEGHTIDLRKAVSRHTVDASGVSAEIIGEGYDMPNDEVRSPCSIHTICH
jgi:hypothetical protein